MVFDAPPEKAHKDARRLIHFGDNKVHRRLETEAERQDFMTYILRFNDDRSMTVREEANAALLILAGSETTASLLPGFAYYIMANPPAYRKLVDEIRESFNSYEEIDFQRVGQLTYLNAAFEESLQAYPHIPAVTPRIVPKEGALIDGQFVPENSHFADADSFIPERWLESRDKRIESDNGPAVRPFSLGPVTVLEESEFWFDIIGNRAFHSLAYAGMHLIATKIF
ncbi:hypothetical protein N7530_001587 [Penicillium desertorum]|uniref:Cytochrome P450 n=1 Tax=Penicillium desertorum TaxID=1303715 RepID=A0A9W9XAD6_9EURO|nr:hypothetical protein N7530_001587 [Penicillium desertorum]